MWLRLLVQQFAQQAATQKVRSAVTDAIRSEIAQQSGEEQPAEPCHVLLVFALNAESGALVDLLEGSRYAKRESYAEWRGTLDDFHLVIAEVGVGAEAATRGTAEAIARHQPPWVVTAGFAGGLKEGLKKGHILMPDELLSLTGERLTTGLKLDPATLSPGLHVGPLLTVDRIIREPQEKQKLAEQHGAVACDMESFPVAQACQQAGVRWLSVRVISDTVDDRLPPEIEKLLAEKSLVGKIGSAAGAILNRFSAAGDLWRLYEDALKCSQRLARFVRGLLPQLK